DAPVEEIGHGELFAGGLGVEVHDYHPGLLVLEQGVRHEEGVVSIRVEREAAHEVYHHELAEGRPECGGAAPGALRGVVRRAEHHGALVKIGLELPARPGVVPEGYGVRPGGEDRVKLAGG